jgi:two-component system chemotaxis response regulator CheY
MSQNQDIVIVVEDSAPNLKIMAHFLKNCDYHVESCADGQQAWDMLERLKGRPELKAVISDIMMPKMDGIELLKKIRGSRDFANLPVVLITAVSDKNHILEAKKHNVSGYILKPISMLKIETKLRKLFPDRFFPRKEG